MGTTAPWETTCRVKCPAGILPKTYWVVVKEGCTLWPYVVLWQDSTCIPRVVSRGPQLALLWKYPRTQKFKLNKVHLRIRKKLEKLLYSLEILIWCSKCHRMALSSVSDFAARPQLRFVCLRVPWVYGIQQVQHVSADRVWNTVHTLWQFENLNRPRRNYSRVNWITGRIKRAFMLPQNKIIDMQTFAYLFYVGCRVSRTAKSHLQGHYRVWRSALQFQL